MNNFFSLQNLSLWTLSKSGLWRYCIILTCSCEASPDFGHFPGSFVNIDNISSCDFFFLYLFYHFCPQVINTLHICCLESQFPDLLCLGLFNFNIDDFSFYYFCLFFNSYSNGSSKGLSQTFCFAHF